MKNNEWGDIEIAKNLNILFIHFERWVVNNVPNYTDNDFGFAEFMSWVRYYVDKQQEEK